MDNTSLNAKASNNDITTINGKISDLNISLANTNSKFFAASSTKLDLNSYTTDGIYVIDGEPTNSPVTNWCLLLVCVSIGTPFQLCMGDTSTNLYKRNRFSNGAFTGAWTKLF